MSQQKPSGTAKALPSEGASCGLKPSKEALEQGYEIDFSHAKELLEEDSFCEDEIDQDDNHSG